MVQVRKPHKCVECLRPILIGEEAEKADGLYDGEFRTFYTCHTCKEIVDYVRNYTNIELCGHGELTETLWEADCLYKKQLIEAEVAQEPFFNEELGIVRGDHCVIATRIPWLSRVGGRFQLVR